jgi:hypothetical protein
MSLKHFSIALSEINAGIPGMVPGKLILLARKLWLCFVSFPAIVLPLVVILPQN